MSPRRRWRSTIRVRLTVLYAGAFFLAGAVLVAVMYVSMGAALDRQVTARIGITEHLNEPASGEADSAQRAHASQAALKAQFQKDRDDTLDSMLIASLIALGAIGLAAGGLGWLVAGRALQPLQEITATAHRVADRSLHERISLEGPDDEIKDLADTFDAMLERLDRAFDSQQRFVANASHELRTPLTISRTLIEVALHNPDAPESLRQLGRTLLAVNERHERLIDGLLTLASSEQAVTEPVLVDLADIARQVISESHDVASVTGVTLQADLQEGPVLGDPVLLERLTHNLIDNAIRYNLPDHGVVTVTTTTVELNARLSVDNTGARVPVYELSGLFEPFRRLSSTDRRADPTDTAISRGAGLGLSIARAIARAHGGDIDASPRPTGGLTVTARLPITRAAPPETSDDPIAGNRT
jgi:signal transduction histidine kinase